MEVCIQFSRFWRRQVVNLGSPWLTVSQMGVHHRGPLQRRLRHLDLVWPPQQSRRGILPERRGAMDDAREE